MKMQGVHGLNTNTPDDEKLLSFSDEIINLSARG